MWYFIAALVVGGSMQGTEQASPSAAQTRTFDFTYSVDVPVVDGSGEVELWLPMPVESPIQLVVETKITASMAYNVIEEKKYGNQFLRFIGTASEFTSQSVRVTYRVTRTAIETAYEDEGRRPPSLHTKSNRQVPISGIIAERASRVVVDTEGTLAVARALYDDVVTSLTYDKSGTGWGQGDAIYACTAEKGNCTDFHSLFIAMCRSRGVPARFTIGFALPSGETHGTISGYHCWAEFFIEGQGWLPVDASEASKHPELTDFFFGHLEPDRLEFTRGRDLVIPGHPNLEPRNYFIYPLLLVDGIEHEGADLRFEFSE